MNDFKKILLINPPFERLFGEGAAPRGVKTPLGLCYIAGLLEKNGFECKVYNTDFIENPNVLSSKSFTKMYKTYLNTLNNLDSKVWIEIKEKLRDFDPDFVGISVMTPMLVSGLNVAKIVKSYNSDIPIVFGGVHPTISPEETIEYDDVDIVVRGEGEKTFLDLIKNYNDKRNIKGITYKSRNKIINNPSRPLIKDLDELPIPARHLLFDYKKYPPETFGNIFASRGCPYNCIFCASNKIWKRTVRYRSPENVIKEIKHIKNNFNTRLFRFEDDSFTLNKKWVFSLCNLIINEKLNIKWTAETRADVVDDELIKKMKEAGCKMIDIGVESGSDTSLKKIKKGVTLDQIRNAFKIIKSNNILTNAFFIVGFPWESEKEINMTVSFMKELNPFHAYFSVSTPYPGTELYDIYDKENLIPKKINWANFFHQSSDMYLTKKYSRNEVSEIIQNAQDEFEKQNRNNIKNLIFSDPLYFFDILISNQYYKPDKIAGAIKYIIGK